MVVDEVMTRSPVCVNAGDTVAEALQTLLEVDVRHLPVVDGRQLVGILSDRDLREVATRQASGDPADKELSALLERPIAEYMASDVVSVDPETEIPEAIDLMLERRIGAIPVVDAESGEVIGIVSYVDILKAARDEL